MNLEYTSVMPPPFATILGVASTTTSRFNPYRWSLRKKNRTWCTGSVPTIRHDRTVPPFLKDEIKLQLRPATSRRESKSEKDDRLFGRGTQSTFKEGN